MKCYGITLCLTTNSEVVRTKCLEVGDKLTLLQARQFALTHEHTQRQLKQMSGQMSGTKDIHSCCMLTWFYFIVQ